MTMTPEMKGVGKVLSPWQRLHDAAPQREAGSRPLSVTPSDLKCSNTRGLLGPHPQPAEGAVACVSHVSPGGRVRAIIRAQGRLAKLCSVAKRWDKVRLEASHPTFCSTKR